jgi:ribonuclease R
MREHLGEEFAGTVSAITSFGLFVTLDALYVEGLVHITELGGEYYRFDEVHQELRGERTGARYAVGTRVRVQVSRVDLDSRASTSAWCAIASRACRRHAPAASERVRPRRWMNCRPCRKPIARVRRLCAARPARSRWLRPSRRAPRATARPRRARGAEAARL